MSRASLVLVALMLLAACSAAERAADECARDPVTTDTGLEFVDLECGDGEAAERGTSVTIEYVAELANGRRFASSTEQGGEFVFPLGRGQVISGLDEGVEGMRVGGRRRLTIPPDLGYGDAGLPPDVGPGETVVYEVTLLEVDEGE